MRLRNETPSRQILCRKRSITAFLLEGFMADDQLKNNLDQLRVLVEDIRKQLEDQKKEPTLKDFVQWLSSEPDWDDDKVAADCAKNMHLVINAFLCQER